VSTAAPCGRMFAEHGEGGGGQLWAAEVRPGCNGVADGCVRKIRELLRGVSADAGGGESRSGSASRSDSLIEFVKTNVAILPLLILTATTGSDELSYGLNDTAVDGFWIGSNWESTGDAPLADTLASIMDSAPYDGAAACAEEGGVINCK
jgi:hypothetical protein